jgi:hypothetical protein
VSGVQPWADVEDLSSIEDHVDAMLTADSGIRRTMVLGSAEAHYLGGIRLVCKRHPGGTMNLRELRRHAANLEHQAGDVVAAEDDPRELGRVGER